MCFSATANFVGSPVVGAVGIATLTQVREPREVVFASLPLLFAVHQFAVVYVVAVVGAALFTGYRWIIAFGVANLIGLTATQILLASSFTSIWCAYAAVVSVMILLFFLRRRRHERREHPERPAVDEHAAAT